MGAEDWFRAASEASQEVLKELRGGLGLDQDHPGAIESFTDFVKAVDWTERWIQGVLVVQVLFFLVVLWSRNRPGLQATLFFTAAAPIYLGSRINTFLAARWRTFARQPYFDDSGIFYSAVIAAPLLCDLFTIVLVHVVHACADLAKMKRIQLAQRARELKKEHERGKKTEKKSEENVGAGEVAPRQGLRHRQRRA